MKKGLVLAGGGTRGACQSGALRALRALKKDDWQVVTGTSVGALNGALVVQKDYEAMDAMWENLKQEDIIEGAFTTDFNLETLFNERNQVATFFKNYVKEKGANITPFINRAKRMFHPDAFFNSPIDFGCIVVKKQNLKPVYVSKEMMKKNGVDWLVASASAFPIFPIYEFEEGEFLDGGYFDNLPIDYALRLGAEEVIAIDLHDPLVHPNFLYRPNVTYIYPRLKLENFMSFDREWLDKLIWHGYHDVMKTYGVYSGWLYTFEKCELPSYFLNFYRDIELLETRIKLASNINESLRSDAAIYSALTDLLHKPVLTDEEFFFGCMDALMDLCKLNQETIYTYEEARNQILVHFKRAVEETYFSFENLGPTTIKEYTKTLTIHGVVERMVHGILYPKDEFLNENLRLTLYPSENALAILVVYMLNELGEK